MLKKPPAERRDRRIAGYVTPADEERIKRLIVEHHYTGVSEVLRVAIATLSEWHEERKDLTQPIV
jgi:Arc/MetJ-type ribon-helix-helix transcriptional regulator